MTAGNGTVSQPVCLQRDVISGGIFATFIKENAQKLRVKPRIDTSHPSPIPRQ
jgi:hypothetical protein